MKYRQGFSRTHRGAAVLIVMLMSVLVVAVSLSMLTRTTTSARITGAHLGAMSANNVLDSTLDYAIAQVVKRKSTAAFDGADYFLAAGTHPLALPSSSTYGAAQRISYGDLNLTCTSIEKRNSGDVATNGKYYLDPAVAINEGDSLRGQWVDRYLMGIAACGAVANGPLGARKQYGVTFLERRDAYLFNYAVFFSATKLRCYNLNGDMVIGGATYANQGIEVGLQTNSRLKFDGTVYTAGTFVDASGLAAIASNQSYLKVWDGTYTGSNKTYFDLKQPAFVWETGVPDFATMMTNFTHGYLQTSEHGVQSANPIGTPASTMAISYVVDPTGVRGAFDDPSQASGKYDINSERTIDAPRRGILASNDSALESAKTMESNKIALKASLYLVVEDNGTVTAFNNPTHALNYKASTDRVAWRASNQDKILELNSGVAAVVPAYNEARSGLTALPRRALYDSHQQGTVTLVDVDLGALRSKINAGSVTYANGSVWNTNSNVTNQSSGGYAQSESLQGWNGVMYVDVEKPNNRFTTVDSLRKWTDSTANASDVGKTAVRLINGQSVPEAKVGSVGFTVATNAGLYTKGHMNADGSMTSGSNSLQDDQSSESAATATKPMAIWADHVTALSPNFDELAQLVVAKPAAPIAGMTASDYLTANFPFRQTGLTVKAETASDALSGLRYGNTSVAYNYNYHGWVSENMEINAAIATGDHDGNGSYKTGAITVSGATSNGLQNFVSYLQAFQSTTAKFRIRGSQVNLWKPKSFYGPYTNSQGSMAYFRNPTRDFGYSSLFARGIMPPGTPVLRDYRKIRYIEIGADTYNHLKTITDPDDWIEYLKTHS